MVLDGCVRGLSVMCAAGMFLAAGCGGAAGIDVTGEDALVHDVPIRDVRQPDDVTLDTVQDASVVPDMTEVVGDLGLDVVQDVPAQDLALDEISGQDEMSPGDAETQDDEMSPGDADTQDDEMSPGDVDAQKDEGVGDEPVDPDVGPPDVGEDTPAGCNDDEFDCGDGTCIKMVWTCDNLEDCIDGSDEIGCGCEADCTGRECGPDPVCGDSCGACGDGMWCSNMGQCAPTGMVKISAGSFFMGCDDRFDTECAAPELPVHAVDLGVFYIDITEVTVDAYAACVTAGGCTPIYNNPACNSGLADHGAYPANCATWNQANTFCAWAGKRLPTEAEWEMAVRKADGRIYPWGTAPATCDFAIMNDGGIGCGLFTTSQVCSRSPAGDTPSGLCDMAGNVTEWVNDWYSATYYSVSPSSTPQGPESGTLKVTRGGGYMSGSIGLRSTARNFFGPNDINYDFGFRCAKTP